MDIRDRAQLHRRAQEALAVRQDQMKKILLYYIGIITVLSLAASGLSALLSNRIADTGGLGAMGLRSALSTAQTVLPLVQMVVLMGLQLGYHRSALEVVRGRVVTRDHLFGGFRRFFPFLRAWILQGLLYFAAGFASLYAGTYLYLMLPVSAAFRNTVTPMITAAMDPSGTVTVTEEILAVIAANIAPILWIFAALYLLVVIPMHYRYRMTIFRILDQPRARAFAALRESRFLMRGNRIALLKLDLSFWWYYLLQVLASLVLYGDLVLPLLGVQLPISATASYFLFLILSLALQFVTFYFFMNRVTVTYALFYSGLLYQQNQRAQTQPPAQEQTPEQEQV